MLFHGTRTIILEINNLILDGYVQLHNLGPPNMLSQQILVGWYVYLNCSVESTLHVYVYSSFSVRHEGVEAKGVSKLKEVFQFQGVVWVWGFIVQLHH